MNKQITYVRAEWNADNARDELDRAKDRLDIALKDIRNVECILKEIGETERDKDVMIISGRVRRTLERLLNSHLHSAYKDLDALIVELGSLERLVSYASAKEEMKET